MGQTGVHISQDSAKTSDSRLRKKKLINSTEVKGDRKVEVEISVLKVSSTRKSTGGHVEVIWKDSNVKAEYKDEYTSGILRQKLIKEAIEELTYFNGNIWEVCTRNEMHRHKDPKVVRSRWVLCKKGDHQEPDV